MKVITYAQLIITKFQFQHVRDWYECTIPDPRSTAGPTGVKIEAIPMPPHTKDVIPEAVSTPFPTLFKVLQDGGSPNSTSGSLLMSKAYSPSLQVM